VPSVDNFAWVPLFRALDQIQARLIVARLDDLHIPVTFRDESVNSVIPMQFGMFAEIIILVPDEYYDRARASLVDMGVLDEDDDDALDDIDDEESWF
jgi:hypothetical protein